VGAHATAFPAGRGGTGAPLYSRHASRRRAPGPSAAVHEHRLELAGGGGAVGSGAVAGSIALVGFGRDSAIEVTASAAALWRLARDADEGARETAERRALRVIGACFLLLAAYVLYASAAVLVGRRPPDVSRVGIVLAALSLLVMPVLVRLKRHVARQLASHALEAESRQTLVCAVLSAILLVGLGLNAALGWWWADPVAGAGDDAADRARGLVRRARRGVLSLTG
jgi:divalent metal cation (Fe/Co/Zn/Cd) transporter